LNRAAHRRVQSPKRRVGVSALLSLTIIKEDKRMVTNETDGSVSFKVYLPHAGNVELVGDFTDWQERRVPLDKLGGGWWEGHARLSEGDHSFSYFVDNRYWMPDYAAHGIRRDGYGNWISNLFVPPARTSPRARRADRKDRPDRASATERWGTGTAAH
jgi:1,4-alpha-glucan branching enzyme